LAFYRKKKARKVTSQEEAQVWNESKQLSYVKFTQANGNGITERDGMGHIHVHTQRSVNSLATPHTLRVS